MTSENGPSFVFSVRFLTAIIAFLGYGVQYIQRVNMSTAIVCMLNNTALKELKSANALTPNDSLVSISSLELGAKITLAGAIGGGSIFTLLIPISAQYSWALLVACRFMTGFCHGAFWPSMSSLWAYWAPAHERSRLVGIANAGSQIGNVVSFSLG